jgi:hypothetical protein
LVWADLASAARASMSVTAISTELSQTTLVPKFAAAYIRKLACGLK